MQVCSEDQFARGREEEETKGREEEETEVWEVVAEVWEGEVEGAKGEVAKVWEDIFFDFFFLKFNNKKRKESLPFYMVCKNIQTFTLQKNLLMSQHNSRDLLEIYNVSTYFQATHEIKKIHEIFSKYIMCQHIFKSLAKLKKFAKSSWNM